MAADHREAAEAGGERRFVLAGQSLTAPRLDAALYIVATPIGNLGDITIRALETLAGADLVACEDTRTSRTLMRRYGITTRLIAAHQHNEAAAGERIADDIRQGKSVALISDAGTPAISDPGERIVSAVIAAGMPVIPIPGASAVLSALVASGLPTETFAFVGFPERKKQALLGQLAAHRRQYAGQTLVYYESPKRALDTLAAMADTFGAESLACLARELTKLHETFIRGSLGDIVTEVRDAAPLKGEIVLAVAVPELLKEDWSDERVDALLVDLMADLPAGRAASEAAQRTGRARRELFDRATALKNHP
ncbi:MAG: 16S rRNA (cytidine(1402)-2'-O)-methyltransferase [Pseudomonadota bacterium]